MNSQIKSEIDFYKDSFLDINKRDNYRRFEIYINPSFRADQYLLDTKLGRVWLSVQNAKTKIISWQEIDVENLEESISGRLLKDLEYEGFKDDVKFLQKK